MLRQAVPADVPAIHGLIVELATYERAADQVALDEAGVHALLFETDPTGLGFREPPARCEVAEVDGAVVGMALWYRSVSTWTGPGLYLEDLYVRPAHRGTGLGRALLARLAAVCVQQGWARFEWAVLDWNEPALGFYRSLGAVGLDEWVVHRVTGDALTALAAGAVDG